MKTTKSYQLALLFSQPGVSALRPLILECISAVASRLAFAERENALVLDLVRSVSTEVGMLSANITLAGTEPEHAATARALQALAGQCDQTVFLLPEGQAARCEVAVGGALEEVQPLMHQRTWLLRADTPAAYRTVCHPGHALGEGDAGTTAAPAAPAHRAEDDDEPWEAHLQSILDAATEHGASSEPDHEVGDLQDVLREAWALMTPEQRGRLMRSDAVDQVFESSAQDNPYCFTPDEDEGSASAPDAPGNA